MSAKRKHRTTDEFLKYLKGEYSRKERYSFERELESDPFDREALEGMELSAPEEIEEDLLSLYATLQKRLHRRRRRTLYSIAATVASLLIVGTVFLNIYNLNPKSTEETLPNDETYLHAEPGIQGRTMEDQEKTKVPELQDIQKEKDISVQEKGPVEEKDPAYEAPVQKNIGVPEKEAANPARMDDALFQPDVTREAEVPVAEAPAPEAGELVVQEAQPRSSRKKGRALESPSTISAEKVEGIMVSSEDKELFPRASTPVADSDSFMVNEMGFLDEVVFIGHEAENEFINSGAEPVGGLEAYKMYMEQNIRFPAGDTLNKREDVLLRFTVEADGSISHIGSLRSPGKPFTEEALRLLKEGPSWTPAQDQNGATTDVVRMRIVFERQ